MAVKIRLARHGAKKAPYYRVVVADGRARRDGRFIEIVGRYNPRTDAVDRRARPREGRRLDRQGRSAHRGRRQDHRHRSRREGDSRRGGQAVQEGRRQGRRRRRGCREGRCRRCGRQEGRRGGRSRREGRRRGRRERPLPKRLAEEVVETAVVEEAAEADVPKRPPPKPRSRKRLPKRPPTPRLPSSQAYAHGFCRRH